MLDEVTVIFVMDNRNKLITILKTNISSIGKLFTKDFILHLVKLLLNNVSIPSYSIK